MTLLMQLKLLLWKNYLIRKRQKARTVIELLWPLCLFLLLVWVRSKGFHQIMHECYYEDKPLPSTGMFRYHQGLICTLNNTCHKYPRFADRDYKEEDSSSFYYLLKEMKLFAQNKTEWQTNIFENYAEEIENLVHAVKTIDTNFSAFPSVEKIIESQNFNQDNIISLQKTVEKESKKVEKLITLLEILGKIDESYENLRAFLKETPYVDNLFIKLHNFMCGNQSSPLTLTALLEVKKTYNSIDKYLSKIDGQPAQIKFEYDKRFSKTCNNIYKKLEASSTFSIMWNAVKPFARGTITFSPKTNKVHKIIDRIQKMMEPLDFPKFDLENYTVNMNPSLYYQTFEHIHFLKNWSESRTEIRRNEIVMELIKSSLRITMNKTDHLLRSLRKVYTKYEQIKNETFHSPKVSVNEILKCYSSITFEGYNSEKEAENRSLKLCEKNDFLAQISFLNLNEKDLKPMVTYKLRMNIDRFPKSLSHIGSVGTKSGPYFDSFEDLHFINYGFIYIQDMIESSIITEITGRADTPGIILKQFPYPCNIQDWFMSYMADTFPLFMVLSWVYTSSMTIKSIVHEKEEKLKEVMHILGLNNGIHWCSWFIDSFIPMCATVCFLSVILVEGGILSNADIGLLIVYLLVYTVATIAQCFLISVFFSKANIAATCGGLIFFITYLPFPFIEYWNDYFTSEMKIASCLLSNVALGLGSKFFAACELNGTGITWKNWNKSSTGNDNFTLSTVMWMLMFDSILYLVLTWYIEGVFPGNVGLPKPWNFPFTKNYWFPYSQARSRLRRYRTKEPVEHIGKISTSFKSEPEPSNLKKGVEIKNLTKVFRSGRKAIYNLTMNFYENHITAFLGRNGAGKTTTMSILTGLFPPTTGTAKIYGMDIRSEMPAIRQSLGVCPQYNILLRNFTVQEHLWFFARLKGHSPGQTEVEIQEMLTDINLLEKRNSYPGHLSGGMRRKLSIAIAFIGGSRTVILDEPTAGVDPYSRQGIWDLLIKYKKGRTIIMTTHIMSEAEMIADRIAIFSNGKLLCYGSSTFLKSNIGSGYILTVDYSLEEENLLDDNKAGKTSSVITKTITSIIPDVAEIDRYGTQAVYSLPKCQDCIHKYPHLFEYMGANKEQLGIRSFGISDTTLEEIFLKVVDEVDNPGAKLQDIKDFENNNRGFSVDDLKTGLEKQYFRQYVALHVKRYHHNKRNLLALGLELILPVVFICICMFITYELPPIEQPNPVLVDHTNCTDCLGGFFEVLPEAKNWTAKYVEELFNRTGLGIKCIANDKGNRDVECRLPKKLKGRISDYEINCQCINGNQICPPCKHYEQPERILMTSGHEMFNMTGINISKWIMDSWKCYGNRRTGGYTFGIEFPEKEKDDNIKIWFNNKWKISPVVYLNNINNVILRASLPKNISDQYGITLLVHPMNYTKKQYETEYRFKAASALLHSVALIFALSFIPASFVMYLIEERVSNSKHLQFVSGVHWVLYWVEAFTWDMVCYTFSIIICVISLIIFQAEAYINPLRLPGLVLLLILYGWATIPLMYPASFFFDIPSSAFVTLSCLNILLGVTTTASTYVLRVFNDEYLAKIEEVLRNVFVMFPHFCLGEGILQIAESHVVTTTLSLYNVNLEPDLLSLSFLGKNFLCLLLEGIIFFTFVLLLERFKKQDRMFTEKLVSMDPPPIEDDDVLAERKRILNTDTDDVLVLRCLTKVHATNNQTAVNQLCLGVKRGECFGLLGLNGAGKTTTFKMLTGDVSITFGDAQILGFSVRNQMATIRSFIGYCPQYDALDSLLTPKEHLELYSQLRNIPLHEINDMVISYLKMFDLMKYKDISTVYLSGGNKRKLSTAIALLGNTHIIFLDEPTCGMDPKGRRFLWSRIKSCILLGRAVVLTSHSMSECEALCSRITIMVNGQMKCLGSTQHLKEKYGQGYNLVIRAQPENLPEVKQKIMKMFPQALEQPSLCSHLKFGIKIDIVSLSKAFISLEDMIVSSLIQDYSISQKSLEEIFLYFAKAQTAEKMGYK